MEEVINNGPVLTEFYELDAVRSGDFSELDSPSNPTELQEVAEQFVLAEQSSYTSSVSAVTPSQETEERLKDLGYM